MKLLFASLTCLLSFATAQDLSLYDTVAANADLSTLTTAIGLAGLQEYLTTTPDLTLFAPTNAALQLLPAKYLTPGFTPHLVYLLEYHVVSGSVLPTASITNDLVIDMLNGESISASVSDAGVVLSGIAFSDARVVVADQSSTTGILHQVDQFFLPELLTYTLYDLTGQAPGFENVLNLVVQSGFEGELTAENRTVLAPSDIAFAALPPEYVAEVSANAVLRDSILLYHIIIGSYPLEIIVDGMEVMTVSGNPLRLGVSGGGRFAQYSAIGPFNNATFEISNLIAANGVAHTVNAVLEAPPLATVPSGPSPTLPVPTFPTPALPVPTLPTATLPGTIFPTPMILPGSLVPTPVVPIAMPGMPISTPVTLPVTSTVPVPAPASFVTTIPLPTSDTATLVPAQPGELSLYDTIALTADLSTLSMAINAAGLVDFLNSTPDLTAFLPINSAFMRLPPKYLTPGFIPHLKYILEYHFIQGIPLTTASISDGMSLTMLNGESVLAAVNETAVLLNGPAFNDSRIIVADLSRTNNDVLHVVDRFFFPQALTLNLYDLATQSTAFVTFLGLVTQSGLEGEFTVANRTILAPSDAAFVTVPADVVASLSTNAELRDSIVLYHVIFGSYPREILFDGIEVMTALGSPLQFEVMGEGETAQYAVIGFLNNATIDPSTNWIANNGIAYSVDALLEPSLLSDNQTLPPSDIVNGSPDSSITTAPATVPISSPTAPSLPTTEPPIGPPPFADPSASSGAWLVGSSLWRVLVVYSFLC
ncbi:hypothetical protein FisN_28Lh076 [Fistulifera solaris]|uniref:FAS1 domain-containing protein n=1 Tax=Fistulifera solaris TaxID=1519565 RepID=A0A1Z5K608_FISSO|nr:hypothetical protein FisN_28Lh076 [Fistulifera solaris]|eukprot:GAX21388.1 hypothetical protein FisN_28Lh076 [Fistulifera solaris]